jgi:hypothetical protein
MNRAIFIFLTILVLPCTVFAQLISITELGLLKVGKEVPGFSGISQKGVAIGSSTPQGKFFVYFINDTLPPTCLDEECGETGKRIAALGGRLIGGSDGKFASLFGLKLLSSKPWKIDRSLIVLTSDKGIIEAIYDKATMTDIEGTVEKLLQK